MPNPSSQQPAAGRADLAALGLRHKTVDCQFKAIGDAGSFSVYFGVLGNLDRGGDILEPKSVRNADEYLRDGWNGAEAPAAFFAQATKTPSGACSGSVAAR